MTTNVTYLIVLNRAVMRLQDQSDILYIGETRQPISKRYQQETSTNNTNKNTQATNIRLTHILAKLDKINVALYFTNTMTQNIAQTDLVYTELQSWDKNYYYKNNISGQNPATISLEKYLLVSYAVDHLEVPPLNNRM